MNSVILSGRLVRDPELRFTNDQKAIASFTLAVDRAKKSDGTTEADFPRINCFGKTAENCSNFLHKGSKVIVEGSIRTGSYKNKHDETVYATDVSAFRVEFIEGFGKKKEEHEETVPSNDIPEGFREEVNEQLPWNM